MDVSNYSNKGNLRLKAGKGTWKNNSFQSGTVDAFIDNGKVTIENCHFISGNDYFQFSGKYDGLNSYMIDRIQIAFEKNYLVNSNPISFSLTSSIFSKRSSTSFETLFNLESAIMNNLLFSFHKCSLTCMT